MKSISKVTEKFTEDYPTWHFAMIEADHGDGKKLNPYHMEGSVWTHTCMVTAMAKKLRCEDLYFQIAALFHDLGKPKTREVRPNGNIAFFNHEGMSTFMAAQILNDFESLGDLDLTPQAKRRILEIISLYGDFYEMSNKSDEDIVKILSSRFYKSSSLFIDVMDHIRCDHSGRICEDKGRAFSSENIYNALQVILENSSGHDKRDTDRSVTLLIGPPGVGKSTWLDKNRKEGDVVISFDDAIMSLADKDLDYSEAWKTVDKTKAQNIISSRFSSASKEEGSSIIVDMTNMSRKSRRKWLGNVPITCRKKAIVFMSGIHNIESRNWNRKKTIDDKIIFGMMKNFMAPTREEFDEIEWIIN